MAERKQLNLATGAIGSGLQGLLTGIRARKSDDLASRQADYNDPNRELGQKDFLALLAEDYKSHNLLNQQATMMGKAPTRYDPSPMIDLMQALKSFPKPGATSGKGSTSSQASIQTPVGAGGGQPQFMTPQQTAQQNSGFTIPGVLAQGQQGIQTAQNSGAPIPVSQNGYTAQQIVDAMRKNGMVQ